MSESEATASDWLPYRARESFNLYELACLLHRQDPQRLCNAVFNELKSHNQATGMDVAEVNFPGFVLSKIEHLPEQMLGPQIGKTLAALKKAVGSITLNETVTRERAWTIAQALGIPWPSELRPVNGPHHFIISAWPQVVPASLLALPPDARITYELSIGRQRGSGTGSAADYLEMVQKTIARQAEGYFTLNEAAQVLADSRPGLVPMELPIRFRAAHAKGELPIHEHGSRFKLEVGEEIRDFHDLLEVSELDTWLRKSAGYGFPPAARPAPPVIAMEGASSRVLMHSTKSRRRDPIDTAIELAQAKCKNAKDTAEVWAQMQVLAQAEHPPLLAVTRKGLKYTRHGDEAAYFNRGALDKRLHPEKRRKAPIASAARR